MRTPCRVAAVFAMFSAPVANAIPAPPEPTVGDLLDSTRFTTDVAPRSPERAVAAKPLVLDLRWTIAPTIDVTTSGGELIARFDQRVDEAAADTFAHAAGNRLARFDWAYDSLVMRAQPGMLLTAEKLPDGLRVTFTPAPATGAAQLHSAAPLALVAAQATAAAGYPGLSRRKIARLAAAAPSDSSLQQALAEAELASERTAEGARRYEALGATPGFEIDPELLDRARRAIGPRAESTALVRNGGGFDQSEVTVRVSMPVRTDASLEAGLRSIWTSAPLFASTGSSRAVSDTAQVGDLALAFRAAPAVRVRAVVVGRLDRNLVGAAGTVAVGDPELQGTARLAWRLPDFTTAEGALLGGYLDRASIGGFVRALPGLGLHAEVGLNRYGLAGDGIVARTRTLEASAEYSVRRQNPALVLAYRLDAEYPGRLTRGPAGLPLVPLLNRENHSGQIVASQWFGTRAAATVAAGWTFDRFGGDGPAVSAAFRYLPGHGWEAGTTIGLSSSSRPEQRDRQIYGRLSLIKRFEG